DRELPASTRFCVMWAEGFFEDTYDQPFFGTYLIAMRKLLVYAYTVLETNLQPVEDREIYRLVFERFGKELQYMRNSIGSLGQTKLQCPHQPSRPIITEDPFTYKLYYDRQEGDHPRYFKKPYLQKSPSVAP
ncbi:12839_t:CDS:1, partial [Acaulospora colombiana]